MSNKPSQALPETPAAEPPAAKTSFSEAAAKLVDAATVIVLITAALYFWGHTYYRGFCAQLGFPFHGISMPLEDYLIVSWMTVFLLLCLVALGLLSAEVGRAFAKKRAEKSPAAFQTLLKLGLSLFLVASVLVAGAVFTLMRASDAADRVLEKHTAVLIRDAEGKAIEGRFMYLHDFGSALLVAEMSSDGKRIVARRLLKASSYSGYSLLDPATPMEWSRK